MQRLILFALAAALIALPAQAQVAVYGLAAFTGIGDIPAGTSNSIFTSPPAYLTNSATHPGFAVGAVADLPHSGLMTLGLDVRGTVSPGTTGGSMFAAAARLALVPRYSRMRPYLLLGGGRASAHSPTYSGTALTLTGPSLSSSNAVFVYGAGLDVRLTRHIDLRAIDVTNGVAPGAASTAPGFFGPYDTSYPGVSFFSAASGILYRFGEARRPAH